MGQSYDSIYGEIESNDCDSYSPFPWIVQGKPHKELYLIVPSSAPRLHLVRSIMADFTHCHFWAQ